MCNSATGHREFGCTRWKVVKTTPSDAAEPRREAADDVVEFVMSNLHKPQGRALLVIYRPRQPPDPEGKVLSVEGWLRSLTHK